MDIFSSQGYLTDPEEGEFSASTKLTRDQTSPKHSLNSIYAGAMCNHESTDAGQRKESILGERFTDKLDKRVGTNSAHERREQLCVQRP